MQNRGSYTFERDVQRSFLPSALANAIPNWLVPILTELDNFRGGQDAVVQRDAPAALFRPRPQNVWTWLGPDPMPIMPVTITFAVNLNDYYLNNINQLSAEVLAYHPLSDAERKRRAPWAKW